MSPPYGSEQHLDASHPSSGTAQHQMQPISNIINKIRTTVYTGTLHDSMSLAKTRKKGYG